MLREKNTFWFTPLYLKFLIRYIVCFLTCNPGVSIFPKKDDHDQIQGLLMSKSSNHHLPQVLGGKLYSERRPSLYACQEVLLEESS